MLRFLTVIALHIVSAIVMIIIMRRACRDSSLTDSEKWDVGRNVVNRIARYSRVKVITHGEQNLPKDPGYVILPNHQGRFDGLAITCAHRQKLSFVINKSRSDKVMEDDFMKLTNAVPIVLEDARQCMASFRTVVDRVCNGDNFCVFPEGIYGGNKNTLSDFKTGCFHFVKKMNCPLVPVCIYDSWRVFNYDKIKDAFKHVDVHVHFLDPIMPSDYLDMTKSDIANLVKSRIQAKLDEVGAAI